MRKNRTTATIFGSLISTLTLTLGLLNNSPASAETRYAHNPNGVYGKMPTSSAIYPKLDADWGKWRYITDELDLSDAESQRVLAALYYNRPHVRAVRLPQYFARLIIRQDSRITCVQDAWLPASQAGWAVTLSAHRTLYIARDSGLLGVTLDDRDIAPIAWTEKQ